MGPWEASFLGFFDADKKQRKMFRPVEDTEAEAAVALLLKGEGRGLQILLVRRAIAPSDPWSGDMAFPGGRRHPEDRSLRETAIRETMEETGIDLCCHRLLGTMEVSTSTVTPELAIQFQEALGADIIMALDECPSYSDDFDAVRQSMERTHHWAQRCQGSQQRDQALYGIVQGGMFEELRRQSATFLTCLGFDGYAIGGLSLGEPKKVTNEIVEETVPLLPKGKPRYLMGVGAPEDLFEGVSRGIDLFDSALPTRIARNGGLFTREGRCIIRNARFRDQDGPIDEGCDCYTCRAFSAAYLHHLFKCEELLAYRLATIHNLRFVLRLMEEMRQQILDGTFSAFKDAFLASYQPCDEEVRQAQRQKWMESRNAKFDQDWSGFSDGDNTC